MILAFKKTFQDGTATHFVEKIYSGVKIGGALFEDFQPKIHSMREGSRWSPGMSIQMATGVRTKSYHQFNYDEPLLGTCISTQEVFMTYFQGSLEVTIDDKYRYRNEIELLIENDGLTKKQFIDWFFPGNKDMWCGQIIHWTNFKY